MQLDYLYNHQTVSYLATNLVSALAGLQMKNLPHY